MMRMGMVGLWLSAVLPMAAMLAWVYPAFSTRWRQATRMSQFGLVAAWLLGSAFLIWLPHDDTFTGLDNMTYRHMSHAFLEGRGFHDPDTVLAGVPEALREDFLLHRGPVGRPTRDRVFELADWHSVSNQPFFMPTLPLAAAGQSPFLAPERFVPLVGALTLALILAAGFCAGGGWGLVAVLALLLGTAWPAWFLRGFYAEGVGALLIAGVVATSSIRRLRGGMAVWAGFSLGLAVAFHPTLVVLSVPVALGLMLERRDGKTVLGLGSGLAAGGFVLWALTRWVCQPYGDWTRWTELKKMIALAPEHEAIAMVLILLACLSIVAIWAGFRPSVRQKLRRLDKQAAPWGWGVLGALPLLLMAGLPGMAGATLRRGAASVWSGIRWPFAWLILVGAALICSKRRPIRERFWLVALCWGAMLFLFIQGLETPVGLWSQRRFLPVMLMGIALFSSPLSDGLGRMASKQWRLWAVVLLLVPALANLVRWPAAFVVVNEEGASEWTQSVSEKIGPDRLVVFDYYNHSIPYAAGLKHRVLGLGEPSRDHWPEVAEWIQGRAQTQEVWVVTSWAPCAMEHGIRFEEVFSMTGRFPVARAKAFFPAVKSHRYVENHFLRALPLAPGEAPAQNKQMDESPIGLRGPWGRVKDTGGGRMARWSRQGSGIIGPVPAPGGRVVMQLECAFMEITPEWNSQTLRIQPPWGGEPARVQVGQGWQTLEVPMLRPPTDEGQAESDTYSLRVEHPYDPAPYGVRGYHSDLGVQIREIRIQAE